MAWRSPFSFRYVPPLPTRTPDMSSKVAPLPSQSTTTAQAGPAQPSAPRAPASQAGNGAISSPSLSAQVASAVFAGLLFGIALHKAGVFQIEVVRNQFLLKDWAMLKAFLSGAASSTLALSVLGETRFKAHVDEASMGYRTDKIGVPATLLGASLLGAGMAISGSCPGTIYVQWGALMWKAVFTFLGMVLGALLFGVLAPELAAFQRWKPTPNGKHTLYELLGVSRLAAGMGVGLLLYACAFVTEALSNTPAYALTDDRWNPIITGTLIGIIQVPLTITLQKNAGASSTFVTFLANALYPCFKGKKRFAFFESKRSSMQNWWQVIYGAAAVAGSAIVLLVASAPSYSPPDSVFMWWEGLLGGVIASAGARLAGGCTSGHGMSGVGHLTLRSFGAVVFMFGSGIAVAFIFFN